MLSRLRFRLIWISCIASSLPCHASLHLLMPVLLRSSKNCIRCLFQHLLLLRIGFGGDVRYDEFSGCSSTTIPGKQSTYTPAFLCGLLGVLWYLFSVMLMLSLSCVLVTYPTHLLPQSKTKLPQIPAYYPLFDVCCLASHRHA